MKVLRLLRNGIAVAVIAVIVITSIVHYGAGVNMVITNQAMESLMELSTRGAQLCHLKFRENINTVETIASSLARINSQQERREVLEAYSQINGIELGIVNASGTGWLNNGQEINIINSDLMYQAESKQSGLTGLCCDFATGKYVIYAFASYDVDANEGNVVFMSIDLSELYDCFDMPLYNGEGYSYVIDRDGYVLIRSKNIDRQNTLASIFELLCDSLNEDAFEKIKAEITSGRSGYFTLMEDEKQCTYAFVPIQGTDGWEFVTVIENQILLASSHKIIRYTVIFDLVIVGVILLILFSFWKVRRGMASEKMRLATIDPITGYSNYAVYQTKVCKLFAENPQEKYLFITLDIKKFRQLNEYYGFEYGDKVLCLVAKKLAEGALGTIYFARTNADLFTCLCTYADSQQWETRFEAFEAIEEFRQDGITFNCGIYVIESGANHQELVNTMLDRSTMARRMIKRDKKKHYQFYAESMRRVELENQQMENEMESALRDGQFHVYLQPKMTSDSEQCHSAEALIRWQHPKKGLIPPFKFISLFEKNQFIIQLDRYVFRECCKKIHKWIIEGKQPCSISINVSKIQVHRDDFFSSYVKMKEEYQIPDGILELEFTESIFVENRVYLSEIIRKFQQAGIICSVDDFGNGYSSFGGLKELPFDILKIDGAFFSNELSTAREKMIVECIVTLAHSLSMKTVAEGIETKEEVEYLKEIGCDLIQGYYYSKPIPMPEFEAKYIKA